MPVFRPVYTSRIQKGGALIPEMRQLVRLWTDASTDHNREAVIRANPLGKVTRSRVVDVLNRIFLPRFVQGPIPGVWRLLRALEDADASPATLRPIYYWVTARAEPLLSDFVTEYLVPMRTTGLRAVGVPDFIAWLATKNLGWSEIVAASWFGLQPKGGRVRHFFVPGSCCVFEAPNFGAAASRVCAVCSLCGGVDDSPDLGQPGRYEDSVFDDLV